MVDFLSQLFGGGAQQEDPQAALLSQYYTPAMRQQALYQGLLGLGGGLIMAGAPTTDQRGQTAGYLAGANAFNSALQHGQQNAMSGAMAAQKIAEMKRKAEQDQQWAQMVRGGAPAPGGVAAAPGAPAGGGSPLDALGLTPQERQMLSMLSREDGMKFLAQRQGKLAETGAWEPHVDPSTGMRGQRNKLTGKFEPDPVAVARASRPEVSVRVENATGEGLAKAGVEAYTASISRLPTIQANLGNLQLMEDALAGASTGWQGENALKVRQALERMGVPTNTSSAELFRSLTTKLRLNDIPKGLGAVSNYEQQMFADASPNLNLSEQGNRIMIQAQRELYNRELKAHQIFTEEMQRSPRDAGAAYTRMAQRVAELGPTFSPEVQQTLIAAAGTKAPAAASGGTFPGQAPAEGGAPPQGRRWNPKTKRVE